MRPTGEGILDVRIGEKELLVSGVQPDSLRRGVNFFPSPGPPSYSVNSLGGSRLVRLKRSLIGARWDQQESARSLGLRRIDSCSVVNADDDTHVGHVESIAHLVAYEDMGTFVPAGSYRLVEANGGVFFAKEDTRGDTVVKNFRYGVEKNTGNRYFESKRSGEYLQWLPRDERTAAIVWTMGHLPVSEVVSLVGEGHSPLSDRFSGMVEYADGATVALKSSSEAAKLTSDDSKITAVIVEFKDITVKWLSADQVSKTAPLPSHFGQVCVICERAEGREKALKWLSMTASPVIEENASELAQKLTAEY